MKLTIPATAVLFLTIGISGQAAAVTQNRSHFQSAVNNCQGALPSFEGAFRKRPLGIANEGGSTAFISCGLSAEVISSTGNASVAALFINRGATAVNVNCTLTEGLAAPAGTPTFFPKTFAVPAGGSTAGTWVSADNGGNRFITPSISCAIPPGVEINGTQTIYNTDVGA